MNTKTSNISTIRPGLLVSLSVRASGNVQYKKKDLQGDHKEKDGTTRAKWETERIVKDAAELARALKVRGAARHLVSRTCAHTTFGLLCPNAWEKSLYENIAEARKLAAEFNAKAKYSCVDVYVMIGRVAQDDVEATRAINSEVRELLREMTEGIKGLDVKRVRDAASKARSVGMMLSEEAQGKVKIAIDAARASARQIVAAGEEAAKAIDKEALKKITASRTAFLDIDPLLAPAPAKQKTKARALDLAPAPVAVPKRRKRAKAA